MYILAPQSRLGTSIPPPLPQTTSFFHRRLQTVSISPHTSPKSHHPRVTHLPRISMVSIFSNHHHPHVSKLPKGSISPRTSQKHHHARLFSISKSPHMFPRNPRPRPLSAVHLSRHSWARLLQMTRLNHRAPVLHLSRQNWYLRPRLLPMARRNHRDHLFRCGYRRPSFAAVVQFQSKMWALVKIPPRQTLPARCISCA